MSRRRSFEGGVLKTAVVFGGIVATLVGGELLASQPVAEAEQPLGQEQTIIVPQENGSFVLELGPIPDLIIPEPIARSQSSQ